MITNYKKYIVENFQEKSVPNIIKKISSIIRKDIKNGEYNKSYSIDGIDFRIIVNYKIGDKMPYYSNINIYKILTEPELPVDIEINVVDRLIDIDYLMSIIVHEIRHIYDIYTVSDDVEMQEFLKSMTITKYKNSEFKEFINLVYLSLEHELIARHNMLYELFRWVGVTDKKELYEIFKKSYTYKALQDLKNFNYKDFISKNDSNKLNEFTGEFAKLMNINFINVDIFYEKWNKIFIDRSDEFMEYVDKLLDDVIYDINNDKVYERLCGYISYNEDINNNICGKLFKNIIEKFENYGCKFFKHII